MAQTQNQKKAADTVAQWLAEREHNYAWLSEQAGVDPGTVGDFLNNERWPKDRTQAKLEDAVGWPRGTIRQIGRGDQVDLSWLVDGTVTLDIAPKFSHDAPSGGMDEVLRSIAELDEKFTQLSNRVLRFEEEAVDTGVRIAARRTRSGMESAGQSRRRHLGRSGEESQDQNIEEPS